MTLISSHRLHTGRGSGCSNGSTKPEQLFATHLPLKSKCCSLDHDCDYFPSLTLLLLNLPKLQHQHNTNIKLSEGSEMKPPR